MNRSRAAVVQWVEMSLRDRLEHGYGMRVERGVEGLLLLASFVAGDLRPAYVAFGLLALQAVVSPVLSPFALLYAAVDRRDRPARLGDVYYDATGSRGAAAISCMVMLTAFVLIHLGVPYAGQVLLGAPCASCLLAATVGFCAGCGYFVLGRDFIIRAAPEGAVDVDVELGDADQHQLPASP